MWFLHVDFSWTFEEAYEEYFPKEGPNGRLDDMYTTKNIIFLKTNKKGNEKKNSTQLRKIDERSIVTARVTS